MNYQYLLSYGLDTHRITAAAAYEDLVLARVCQQQRGLYRVVTEAGEKAATVAGKFAYEATVNSDFPAVGDWVLLDHNAVIQRLLPRKSAFMRRAAGTGHSAQVVAANVDLVFLTMSLNADFNLRRLERTLTVAWDSGATPVIVLTKADLCDHVDAVLDEVAAVAIGVEVIVCSALAGDNVKAVSERIAAGQTVAFIGSSGVGKSTLINHLLGRETLATAAIREGDDKGRHTTSHRQLLLVPGGGIVIDTPGMRELQIDGADLSRTFEDIEALALNCKFRDCGHTTEPGCAVLDAVANGALAPKRLENYRKLLAEAAYAGLNARQLEEEKIKRMFGSKGEMKQVMRQIKQKRK